MNILLLNFNEHFIIFQEFHNKPKTHTMNTLQNTSLPRVLFFLSQLLYQSIQLYRPNQSPTTIWLRQLLDTLPPNIAILIILALLLGSVYGWVMFLLLKRTTLVMPVIEQLGIPVALILLPEFQVDGFQQILWRVLPTIVVTVSTCLHIYFTISIHSSPHLNQQIKADLYYPLFSIARAWSLIILKNYIDQTYLIFALVTLQLISTTYKYFNILYYDPQAQWCSLITQLWGWLSILQWLLLVNNMLHLLLNILIPILYILAFSPNPLLIVTFESKITRYLERIRKSQAVSYYTFLIIYYVSISVRDSRRYLGHVWTSEFRVFIAEKMGERDCQLREYVDRLKATRIKRIQHGQEGLESSKELLNTIQGHNLSHTYNYNQTTYNHNQTTYNPNQIHNQSHNQSYKYKQINTSNIIQQQSPLTSLNLPTLQHIIQQQYLSKQSHKHTFQTLYYILYLFQELPAMSPQYMFKLYYQILQNVRPSDHYIPQIEMNIMYNLLRARKNAYEYAGNHVEEIKQYDELHAELYRFVKNQRKFYGLVRDAEIDLECYREYLDGKIGLKDRIGKMMGVLDFLYPCCQTLAMKMYIIERHIHNNQLLAEEKLRISLDRISSKRTQIINFSDKSHDTDTCIFTCTYIGSRGQVRHYNKLFCQMFQVKSESIKIKDILPVQWRDAHEQAIQVDSNLQKLYEHDHENVYYVQARISRKLMEARYLKIIPYFQLESEMLLLCQMKVDNSRSIFIRELNTEDQLGLEHNRSKHRITFQNDEEDFDTLNLQERTLQIFNKKYIAQASTKFMNIFTKHLIQSKMQINLNQDIQAIINLGTNEYLQKTKTIQKSKGKVNILGMLIWPFIIQMFLYSVLFGSGATSISTSFVAYIDMLSRFARLKLGYYGLTMSLTPYYKITYTYNCHLNNSQANFPGLAQDLLRMENMYNTHKTFISQLSGYKQLVGPIYQQYYSIDIKKYKTYRNIINHISIFHTLYDSSSNLIKKGQYNHWIVQHFNTIISMQQQLLFDDNYLEYIVTRETEKLLKSGTAESEVVFWLVDFFHVLAPILAYFVFWKYKRNVEKILSKPLHMNKDEITQFNKNFKLISQYLEKQHTVSRNIPESNLSVAAQSLLSINERSDSRFKSNKVFQQKQPEPIVVKGQFYKYFKFIVILLGFHMLSIMVFSKKLFVAKSQFMSTLQSKLKSFEDFAKFNTDVLNMYNNFLDVVAYPEIFSKQQLQNKLIKIEIMRKNINEVNVTSLINNMMIQSQRSQQILFGDLCFQNNLCSISNYSRGPYPIQLNIFLTTFYKLQSGYSNSTSRDEQFNTLLYESFVEIQSIVELNYIIKIINGKAVDSILIQHEVWIALSYVGFGVFMIIMALGVWWMLSTAKRYGEEVLAMLPSGQLCNAKFIEFQINSICHRTNFAKDYIVQ